jgi:hypothetical protein
MNRDDKAHRFVVTWNAFLDGNRLAYLALILAIGVDSLVFMSGLFGAQALRSPLSDVPSPKARSAEQLQAVIDTALLPHTYENARIVLNAMRAMTPRDGYSQWISIRDDDPHAPDLHRVLNAGATIGAVRHVEGNVYELRSELFEYLSLVAKKAFVADKNHVALADLERIVTVALVPDVKANVETVLHYVHPIEDRPTFLEKVGLRSPHDFTAEIRLDEVVDSEHKRIVRGALNAGASAEGVQRADNNHYFISRDFYRTLARIRARFLVGTSQVALESASSQQRLREAPRAAIAATRNRDAQAQLSHQPQQLPNSTTGETAEQIFWGELLGSIGLTLGSAGRLLQPAVSHHADMAWQALSQRAHSNYRLRKFLEEAEDETRASIDEKYSELRSRLQGDPEALSVLDGVTGELQSLLKGLLLLPEIGVMQGLIERLEDAVQSDSGPQADDEELYRLLRDVQSTIKDFDRSQPENWQYVVQIIQGRAGGPSNYELGAVDPANKRPI